MTQFLGLLRGPWPTYLVMLKQCAFNKGWFRSRPRRGWRVWRQRSRNISSRSCMEWLGRLRTVESTDVENTFWAMRNAHLSQGKNTLFYSRSSTNGGLSMAMSDLFTKVTNWAMITSWRPQQFLGDILVELVKLEAQRTLGTPVRLGHGWFSYWGIASISILSIPAGQATRFLSVQCQVTKACISMDVLSCWDLQELMNNWLVVWNIFYVPHILGIISPIWLIFFGGGRSTTNQITYE